MGIDNEPGQKRPSSLTEAGILPPKRSILPTRSVTEAAPVHQQVTRQPEQQQLQQDDSLIRREAISTGELRRRIADTGELIAVTTEQEASAARIIALANENPEQLKNPGFVEAVDRFFSVMRPHMRGSEEDKDVSAAHAAVIAAKNDVHLRGERDEHRQNAKLAMDKMVIARTEAETDPLTGEYNMRGLNRVLNEVLLFGVEGGVIIEFDLNLMKRVNDLFGEDAGDEMIRLAVEGVRAGLRGTDVVARPKGDEIYAIIRGVTAEQARKIIKEKIDAELQARKIPQLPGQSISLGGGFMEFHPDNFKGLSKEEYEEKVKDMLRQVMAAMKEAKDLAKADTSPTHREYIDGNNPKAQARYHALKADKTVKIDFER